MTNEVFETFGRDLFPYVSVDTETTGVDPETCQIIEITAIEFDDSGNIGNKITMFLKPYGVDSIPASATKVNNITWDMVKDKPYWKDVRLDFAKFIGKRCVVGQNVIAYDIPAMRIKPASVEDTLVMAREVFPGKKNSLIHLCTRLGIGWDASLAHRSEYDVIKSIEAFISLRNYKKIKGTAIFDLADELFPGKKENLEALSKRMKIGFNESIYKDYKLYNDQVDALFASLMEERMNRTATLDFVGSNGNTKKYVIKVDRIALAGMKLTDNERADAKNIPYSYSKRGDFDRCPYAFYMKNVRKIKQGVSPILQLGSGVHLVMELSGVAVERMNFGLILKSFYKEKNIGRSVAEAMLNLFGVQITPRDYDAVAEKVFHNKHLCKQILGAEYKDVTRKIRDVIDNFLDCYKKPNPDEYAAIITQAIQRGRLDESTASDLEFICWKYYRIMDLSAFPGETVYYEKKIAFDNNWVPTEFMGRKAAVRSVIDVLHVDSYSDVFIKDYKTDRRLPTKKEFEANRQLKEYAGEIAILVGDTAPSITIEMIYVRHGVSYKKTFLKEDYEKLIQGVKDTVSSFRGSVDEEAKKEIPFCAERNEFCCYCPVLEKGMCPLFDEEVIKPLDNPLEFIPRSAEDVQSAWKHIEITEKANERLRKSIKGYMKNANSSIQIDEKARLDYYSKETFDYDSVELTKILTEKNESGLLKFPLEAYLKSYSITSSQFDKMCSRLDLEFTEEERLRFSKKRIKNEFKALTKNEVVDGNYLNDWEE